MGTDYEREAQRDQIEQNSAKLSWAFDKRHSESIGCIYFPKPIDFGITFYQYPTMAYGFETLSYDEDGEFFPMCSGFVYDWVQDARGYWIGAYVGVNITQPPDPGSASNFYTPILEHHFTFAAKAFKDIQQVEGNIDLGVTT